MRLKPAREKFSGRGGVKMGAPTALGMEERMWAYPFCVPTGPRPGSPRTRQNVRPHWAHVDSQTHPQNGRPLIHVMGSHTSVIVARPCKSTCPHDLLASRHIHVSPRAHTKFGYPICDWTPTFRATLDDHTRYLMPTKSLGAHMYKWVPKTRLFWTPICVQEVLWTST